MTIEYLQRKEVKSLFFDTLAYFKNNGESLGFDYLEKNSFYNSEGIYTTEYLFHIRKSCKDRQYMRFSTCWGEKYYYIILYKYASTGYYFEIPFGRNCVINNIIYIYVNPRNITTNRILNDLGFKFEDSFSHEKHEALKNAYISVNGQKGINKGYEVLSSTLDDFSYEMATLVQSVATHQNILVTKKYYPKPITATSFYEGDNITKEVTHKKRNASVVKLKKELALKENGKLICEICGFDFNKTYGHRLGNNFIECHHIEQLSKKLDRKVTVNNLALVCSNCHQMLHRRTPPYKLNEVAQSLKRKG